MDQCFHFMHKTCNCLQIHIKVTNRVKVRLSGGTSFEETQLSAQKRNQNNSKEIKTSVDQTQIDQGQV